MPSSRRSKLTSLALAAAIAASGAVATTAATIATATTAQAASAVGGQITRSEVIQRAQYWLGKSITYNQGGSYPDSSGRYYRTDCGGYVDMAWHLADGPNTQGLAGSAYTTQISRSDLKAGDILDSFYDHVILFEKWDDAAHTTFSYYSFGSTPVKHVTGVSINAAYFDSHPNGDYKAYRYKNIVDDAPSGPVRPARTVVADFNGDGKQDVAGIDANSNMRLYPGDGAGHVGGGSDMLGSTGLWANFKAIAAGDFNGDGKQDIAGIDANDNLRLYIGDGAGHLSGGDAMLGTNGAWANFRAIAAGDFNGDGKQDIAGIDANDNLNLYTGDGAGHLGGGGAMLGSTGLWANFKAIAAGDFNGDGKQDIAGIDANNNLNLYTGDGQGHVSGGGAMLGTNGAWVNFRSVMGGDLNGDGKQDIAGIDANNDLKLYTGDGQGHVGGGSAMLPGSGLWAGF
ncbi:VCBS repeat-containing protein [Kitasatospora sp. NA04385]|uniref:FG-GAP repeat domain-containing protein n=1 Tax=Kitasatospora sp. NA04385 TaxID=2742135 RepID=UPI0015927BD1|nr:VCBS repeat-containing protein [Kitasatospora sp. NA04385]QKW19889.1 VCBS repeat-containing protein [Kitasatospora sp. NA04385]